MPTDEGRTMSFVAFKRYLIVSAIFFGLSLAILLTTFILMWIDINDMRVASREAIIVMQDQENLLKNYNSVIRQIEKEYNKKLREKEELGDK